MPLPPAPPWLTQPTREPSDPHWCPPDRVGREGVSWNPHPLGSPRSPCPLQPRGAQLRTLLSTQGLGNHPLPDSTASVGSLGVLPREVGAPCPSRGLEVVGTGTAVANPIAHHPCDTFRHPSGMQHGTAPAPALRLTLWNRGPVNSTSKHPWKP